MAPKQISSCKQSSFVPMTLLEPPSVPCFRITELSLPWSAFLHMVFPKWKGPLVPHGLGNNMLAKMRPTKLRSLCGITANIGFMHSPYDTTVSVSRSATVPHAKCYLIKIARR